MKHNKIYKRAVFWGNMARLIIAPSSNNPNSLNYRTDNNSQSGTLSYSERGFDCKNESVLRDFLSQGYSVQIPFFSGKKIPQNIKDEISRIEKEVEK